MTADPSDRSDALALFRNCFKQYSEVLKQSVMISESRIGVNHTGRQNRILAVFAKTILHAISLHTTTQPATKHGTGLLDHLTVAMLARSIIDAGLMTMYLSEQTLTLEQWKLRREILGLHELTNRKRFLESAQKAIRAKGAPQDLPFFENYEERKTESRARIRQLAISLSYKEEQVAKFQEGQLVFLEGSRGAAREAGWNVDAYDHHQSYYSAYVHSHPVSFLRWDEQAISFTHPSSFQLAFSAAALEAAGVYLATVNARISDFTGDFNLDPLGQVD